MPLPITKREFDRLGVRLVAHVSPSEADLADLETALAAYQEVLERVKIHLRDLGFAPTQRVKTTSTMIDKLRRTPGMDLSRMQDIAGARLTVRNLTAQDQAKDQIGEFFTAQGSRVREVDRREDPRFGYRAMHLVVRVDDLPVEIQIRTELQDSWAQIVERLGDRWGRGIRYGQEPDNPEGLVRSGKSVYTRRELMALLITLSDSIWDVERSRLRLDMLKQLLVMVNSLLQETRSRVSDEQLGGQVPLDLATKSMARLAARSDELDAEARALLAIPADGLTIAQLRRVLEITLGLLLGDNSDIADQVAAAEQQVRDILQVVAAATDEGA